MHRISYLFIYRYPAIKTELDPVLQEIKDNAEYMTLPGLVVQ